MRVGVLTTSYPRHADDWAGRFVAELADWLAEQGEVVEVLAPHPARSINPAVSVRSLRYARTPRLLYGAGAPDNLFGSGPVVRRARAWAQAPVFVSQLARACWQQSRSWDRLLSHWLIPSGLVASQAGRGLPHLAIAHSSDVHILRRSRLGGHLLRLILRSRCALVLTSESLRPSLHALGGLGRAERAQLERAPVIPMGVKPSVGSREALGGIEAVEALRRDLPIVLFLGRLVPVKGVDLLIEACDGLPVQLVVIGDGPERETVEALARRKRVRARFLGEQGRRVSWACLRAADLLVLPSRVLPDGRTDSAPLAALEGLSAGLPVVASRVGGLAALIDDGVQGLLVPPEDVLSLREALGALATNPARRAAMSVAARARGELFSWDQVGAKLRDLLVGL